MKSEAEKKGKKELTKEGVCGNINKLSGERREKKEKRETRVSKNF